MSGHHKWAELEAKMDPERLARIKERVDAALAEMDKPLTITLEGDAANCLRVYADERQMTPAEYVGELVLAEAEPGYSA